MPAFSILWYGGRMERDVLNACLDYLAIKHIFAWRNNTGAFPIEMPGQTRRFIKFGRKGSSDIIGILPDGKFLAVECKDKYGKLRIEQYDFLEDIKNNNGLAILARSLEDLIDGLQRAGYK